MPIYQSFKNFDAANIMWFTVMLTKIDMILTPSNQPILRVTSLSIKMYESYSSTGSSSTYINWEESSLITVTVRLQSSDTDANRLVLK